MKNIVMMVIVFFLIVSCSKDVPVSPVEAPTPTVVLTPTVVATVAHRNTLLNIDAVSFVSNLKFVIKELIIRDAELGKTLAKCDFAISSSPTASELSIIDKSEQGNGKCAIALIRAVDYSTPDSIWHEYNLSQENDHILIAAVIPLGESDFPLLVIPEGMYDAEYFIRMMGHEAFHTLRYLNNKNCPATAEKSCEIKEEVLAFQRQFMLLDAYLVKTGQVESYEEKGLTYVPGSTEINQLALKHEHILYMRNKEGILYEFLYDMNYGETD